jgi:hypothetical protein
MQETVKTSSHDTCQVNASDSRGHNGKEHMDQKIPMPMLIRVLEGVAVATKVSEDDVKLAAKWLADPDRSNSAPSTDTEDQCPSATGPATIYTTREWHELVRTRPSNDKVQRLASLTVAVAFLRTTSRNKLALTASDLDITWDLIRAALSSPLGTVVRGSQGFLTVPLCSILKDGNIEELFRLHLWLPDGQRGHPDFNLHAHQAFGKSWILAGVGKDYRYKVDAVDQPELATHAKYSIAWKDGKTQDNSYKTHPTSSHVENTGELVRVTTTGSSTHARDDSYSIPAAAFHSSEVAPDAFHATLFYFDASRGFSRDAPVLGPKDRESCTQLRDPAGMSAGRVAEIVQALRFYEQKLYQGEQCARRAEHEEALNAFNSALVAIESLNSFPNYHQHRRLALEKLESCLY